MLGVENPALINTGCDGHDLNTSLNLRAAFKFEKSTPGKKTVHATGT